MVQEYCHECNDQWILVETLHFAQGHLASRTNVLLLIVCWESPTDLTMALQQHKKKNVFSKTGKGAAKAKSSVRY